MKFEKRPAEQPSFNYGWRLVVRFGAALVVLGVAWALLEIIGKVWDVYF